MEKETFANLVICTVCTIFALIAVAVTIIFGAWWNLGAGAGFALIGYVHYVDDEYGVTSVKAYFANRKSIK